MFNWYGHPFPPPKDQTAVENHSSNELPADGSGSSQSRRTAGRAAESQLPSLLALTAQLAAAFCQSAIVLAGEPGIRSREFFCSQIETASIGILAQLAQGNNLHSATYAEQVHAMTALRGARASADELRRLICVAVTRRYVSSEVAAPVIEQADETIALLMAVSVTARSTNPLMAA